MALAVLLFWQYATSYVSSRMPTRCGQILSSPALIVAFRGKALHKVMRKHRVSSGDLYGALRGAGIWSIREVEVIAIEPTGQFSVFKRSEYPKEYEPDVLWELAGYRALREQEDENKEQSPRSCEDRKDEDQDDAAIEAC